MLDPTRLTLYVADTGFNGTQFKNDVLMNRFGIQINKTSINSVLMIFTIGVTWSALDYLLDSLKQFVQSLEEQMGGASSAEMTLFKNRVNSPYDESSTATGLFLFSSCLQAGYGEPGGRHEGSLLHELYGRKP